MLHEALYDMFVFSLKGCQREKQVSSSSFYLVKVDVTNDLHS